MYVHTNIEMKINVIFKMIQLKISLLVGIVNIDSKGFVITYNQLNNYQFDRSNAHVCM